MSTVKDQQQPPAHPAGHAEQPPQRPSSIKLFFIFARIGITSFGGGLSGWFMREFVYQRGWLTEDEFLNGLALSQALPGVNVKNLAIWIGYRLHGWRGALAGFCGIIFPPAVVIVILGLFFSTLANVPLAHTALSGAAAAAIGLSLSMGIAAARRLPRRAFPFLVLVATFAAVAVFEVSIVWTVLVAGTLSVAREYVLLRRNDREA
jgi:chromate transporter